ncbi:MAG: phosphoglycerate kinase [bacterium]
MKSIKEAGDLKGKRVLVRVDWSVPLVNGAVLDDFQIKESLPTIEYLKKSGAEVIIATHLDSIDPSVAPLLKFVPEGVTILDNLRADPREKTNDEGFAKELAGKADIFVNDAFPESHRNYASIVGVPKFLPSFAGLGFMREIEELSKVFNPEHPFLLIIGGAKFETKIPLIKKFLNIADGIFIAGAIAKPAFDAGLGDNPKITFPHGDITALDADQETLENCKLKIENSRLIVWNGPLGKYENGYTKGTVALTQMLAESGKHVIVGGGDTLATIRELDLYDKFSFVSTGGGAMLEFLATGTLPGIQALR